MRLTWGLSLLLLASAAAGCGPHSAGGQAHTGRPDAKPAAVRLVCNGSTEACPRAPHYQTVQAAVDAAQPGDWVLIWPGVYHENDPSHDAGIWITTPDLHIRGMSRNGVIIDGSHGTARHPCPSSPRLQDYAPRDGITAWKANGVSIENLTVCDYLGGMHGSHGSEVLWNGGVDTDTIGLTGYEGSYLTATSLYQPRTTRDSHLAQYGIYVGNAQGPGSIANSYASNMAGAAFYVGACRRACDTRLDRDQGTYSAVGYLGTNSGGSLIITNSTFDDNRAGLVPSSLNNDDAPPPQDGRCPGAASRSCTVIEHDVVINNDNADAPVYGTAPPVGVGIDLDGGQFDTVKDNTISGNHSWGIIVNDSVDVLGKLKGAHCQDGYPEVPNRGLCTIPARGNMIYSNDFRANGTFGNLADADVAATAITAGSAAPRNCFFDNHDVRGQLTSVPPDIEADGVDGMPCDKPGTGGDAVVVKELTCATLSGVCTIQGARYPRQAVVRIAPIPPLSSMPDPCSGVPANAFCEQ